MTLLAFVTLPLYKSSSADAWKMTNLSRAREAANELVNAINSVYSGGVGSKQTVEYSLPDSVWQIRVGVDVDGTDIVPQDNRMDVQIEMNWEEENIVLVDTIIPSQYMDGWENVPLIDCDLSKDPGDHRVEVSYENYPTIVLKET